MPTASFRPNVAIGTLLSAVRLPLLGRIRDLHPLDYAHVGRTTVQATPKTGFAFDKWSDGSTQNPRTVKLTSDLTLTASFKTATTGGGGDQGGGTLGD